MFDAIPGVYMIKCESTKKYIIGETGNVSKRLLYHIQNLKGNRHENPYLQKAWNKYGKDNFSYHVLEYCDFSECKIREDYYCKLYDSHNPSKGFNLRATGTDLKNKTSQETIDKIKTSLKNSEKFKNRDTGKGMRGKTHSDKTKIQMSKSAKNKIVSAKSKERMSIAQKGKKLKEDTIRKIVDTRKKNNKIWHNEATKQKMSEASKGRLKTKEHCKNMSLAKSKPILQYDLNNNFIKEWVSATYVEEFLKYSSSCISKCCNNKRKTHKKFIWKYKQS